MLIIENIKIAFNSLLSNKVRSLFTMLCIIIGIGPVIAIMTVNSSLGNVVPDYLQEMGANNITAGIKKKTQKESASTNGIKPGNLITDEMITRLREKFPGKIDAIAISESVGNGTANKGSISADIVINGINDEYFQSSQITLLAGRKIKSSDIEGNKKVIMVSDKAAESLFNGDIESALWQKIIINANGKYEDFYITGIYKYEENTFSSEGSNITTMAYIPLPAAKEWLHSGKGYSQFTVVAAKDIESVSLFAEEIEQYLETYLNNEDYETMVSVIEPVTGLVYKIMDTVTIAAAIIAGISLIAGVAGIIMLPVTDRTEETGTRKSFTARNSSIRMQFITESIILFLTGGISGIITGLIIGAITANILGYQTAVPGMAIIISICFLTAMGIFSGYYTASKTAKMDTVEALKY